MPPVKTVFKKLLTHINNLGVFNRPTAVSFWPKWAKKDAAYVLNAPANVKKRMPHYLDSWPPTVNIGVAMCLSSPLSLCVIKSFGKVNPKKYRISKRILGIIVKLNKLSIYATF